MTIRYGEKARGRRRSGCNAARRADRFRTGYKKPLQHKIILEQAKVPIIVDAGVGIASDAAIAMELGCDAVLINTAVAGAKYPIMMAEAIKHAVNSRKARL